MVIVLFILPMLVSRRRNNILIPTPTATAKLVATIVPVAFAQSSPKKLKILTILVLIHSNILTVPDTTSANNLSVGNIPTLNDPAMIPN